jgi:hypothetical protein
MWCLQLESDIDGFLRVKVRSGAGLMNDNSRESD